MEEILELIDERGEEIIKILKRLGGNDNQETTRSHELRQRKPLRDFHFRESLVEQEGIVAKILAAIGSLIAQGNQLSKTALALHVVLKELFVARTQ